MADDQEENEAALHARALLERLRGQQARTDACAARVLVALRQALRETGARYGVQQVRLFGSLARGDFDEERSDVDLLVWGIPAEERLNLVADLWDQVGRPVHVLRAETASPGLVARVLAEGMVLDVA